MTHSIINRTKSRKGEMKTQEGNKQQIQILYMIQFYRFDTQLFGTLVLLRKRNLSTRLPLFDIYLYSHYMTRIFCSMSSIYSSLSVFAFQFFKEICVSDPDITEFNFITITYVITFF